MFSCAVPLPEVSIVISPETPSTVEAVAVCACEPVSFVVAECAWDPELLTVTEWLCATALLAVAECPCSPLVVVW